MHNAGASDNNGEMWEDISPELGRGRNSLNPVVPDAISAGAQKKKVYLATEEDLKNLRRRLDEQIARNGQLEGRIELLNAQLRQFSDKQSAILNSINTQINGKIDLLNVEIARKGAEINDAYDKTEASLRKIQVDYETKFKDIVQTYEALIKQKADTVDSIIGKATIGFLGGRFADKSGEEAKSRKIYLRWFYILLLIALGFGALVVVCSLLTMPESGDIIESLKVMLMRFLGLLPIYMPLLWAIGHFNRWAAEKNRLVEEYEHKKVVSETYVGVSDQIESLANKGVRSAQALLGKLLDGTIAVVCYNPNKAVDVVNTTNPIGETIESVSKATAPIADAIKGTSNESK